MRIDYDPAKSERNARKRDLSFDRAADFDWEEAIYREDIRHAYPERRFVAIGELAGRLHVCCFTPIPGGVRVFSLRKANGREVRRYEEETADRQGR